MHGLSASCTVLVDCVTGGKYLRCLAGSSSRRIRDTLLDNVDTGSASRLVSQAEDAGIQAEIEQDRANAKRDVRDSEQPRSVHEEKSEPSGKTSAIQAGAAWDKARLGGQGISFNKDSCLKGTCTWACDLTRSERSHHRSLFAASLLTGAEDNGWGPGIPDLEREEWDWNSAPGQSSSRSSGNGSRAGGWARQKSGPAAESTWNQPGTARVTPSAEKHSNILILMKMRNPQRPSRLTLWLLICLPSWLCEQTPMAAARAASSACQTHRACHLLAAMRILQARCVIAS